MTIIFLFQIYNYLIHALFCLTMPSGRTCVLCKHRQFPCSALCQLNADDEDPLSQGTMSALNEPWEEQDSHCTASKTAGFGKENTTYASQDCSTSTVSGQSSSNGLRINTLPDNQAAQCRVNEDKNTDQCSQVFGDELDFVTTKSVVYFCMNCRVTNTNPQPYCQNKGHLIMTRKITKRVFSCSFCHTSATTLKPLPEASCRSCGRFSWKTREMNASSSIQAPMPNKLTLKKQPRTPPLTPILRDLLQSSPFGEPVIPNLRKCPLTGEEYIADIPESSESETSEDFSYWTEEDFPGEKISKQLVKETIDSALKQDQNASSPQIQSPSRLPGPSEDGDDAASSPKGNKDQRVDEAIPQQLPRQHVTFFSTQDVNGGTSKTCTAGHEGDATIPSCCSSPVSECVPEERTGLSNHGDQADFPLSSDLAEQEADTVQEPKQHPSSKQGLTMLEIRAQNIQELKNLRAKLGFDVENRKLNCSDRKPRARKRSKPASCTSSSRPTTRSSTSAHLKVKSCNTPQGTGSRKTADLSGDQLGSDSEFDDMPLYKRSNYTAVPSSTLKSKEQDLEKGFLNPFYRPHPSSVDRSEQNIKQHKGDECTGGKVSKNSFPPMNPHQISFKNTAGKIVGLNSEEYSNRFAAMDKITPKTEKQYNWVWTQFLQYLGRALPPGSTKIQELLDSTLPTAEVNQLLCKYLIDRCNYRVFRDTGEIQPLDTSTQEKYWFGLKHSFKTKTNYKLSDLDFNLARECKGSAMRLAKNNREKGLGQLSNQSIPLTNSQILYLLSNDQLSVYTPRGLQWLTYLLIMLYFLPRCGEEVCNMARGDFSRVYGPDGKVVGVVYVPQGTLKKDRGNVTQTDAAGYYKRPFALVTREDKLNFHLVLSTMERQLDMLPHEGPRSTQKIFKQTKLSFPGPDEPFYFEGDLGTQSFRSILRNMIHATGLKAHPKQLQNIAMRSTIFSLHRQIGISHSETQSMAGHGSVKTGLIYKRGDLEYSGEVNAQIQEVIGGVNVIRPDRSYVRLVDNQVVQPRPYAKAFTADDCTPPEFLPISGMDLDEYYSHVHDEMNRTRTPNISTVQLPIPPTDCHTPDPSSSLLGTFEIVPGVNAAQVENIFDNTSPSLHQAGSSSVGGNVEVGQSVPRATGNGNAKKIVLKLKKTGTDWHFPEPDTAAAKKECSMKGKNNQLKLSAPQYLSSGLTISKDRPAGLTPWRAEMVAPKSLFRMPIQTSSAMVTSAVGSSKAKESKGWKI